MALRQKRNVHDIIFYREPQSCPQPFHCGVWYTDVGILTDCLVRRRERSRLVRRTPSWQTASLQELLEKIKTQQDAIQTLDATATIEPSVSSPLGEIVHYRDVRAFILVRKPAFIRMIGLYPVVQNKAFDMASDGEQIPALHSGQESVYHW